MVFETFYSKLKSNKIEFWRENNFSDLKFLNFHSKSKSKSKSILAGKLFIQNQTRKKCDFVWKIILKSRNPHSTWKSKKSYIFGGKIHKPANNRHLPAVVSYRSSFDVSMGNESSPKLFISSMVKYRYDCSLVASSPTDKKVQSTLIHLHTS